MMWRSLLTLSSLLLAFSLQAANHYVLDGGSGDGSSWSSAWDSLPATLVRGDTYYIGDGSYPSYDFNDAASGSTLITVKKATSSDHGTETGWSSTYGDGQAVFSNAGTCLTFSSPYWLFDGQVGSDNSGHGFKVVVDSPTAGSSRGIRVTASNITVEHAELYGAMDVNGGAIADDVAQDGIYMNTAGATNLTVRSCYIHDWKRMGIVFVQTSDCLVENSYLYHTYSYAAQHGQAIQIGEADCQRITIRYTKFKDTHGTGFIVLLGYTHTDVQIYGCSFWSTETAAYGNDGTAFAIGCTDGADYPIRTLIYNCTFVGLDNRTGSGSINFGGLGEDNEARNCLWLNSSVSFSATTLTHDYNWFYPSGGTGGDYGESNGQVGSGDPFTSSGTGNFILTANTTAGADLGSPYNVDPLGNARTTWTRGAYEFGSSGGGGGDTTPPTLSAIESYPSTTSAVVTWTTDEAATSILQWGPTTAYGSTSTNASPTTSHNLTASGLSQGTLYHYRVHSTDAAGNTATSADGTFTTAAAGDPESAAGLGGGRIRAGRWR